MDKHSSSRLIGLDIFRSIAIILILVTHSSLFFLSPNTPMRFDWYSLLGYSGTNIFIVLSGYLVGRELLLKMNSAQKPFTLLLNFYKKHFLRILPLYYLVLIILIVIESLKIKSFFFPWRFFFFLQNFDHSTVDFFGVSWFLCLTFFFYLLAPLIFLILIPELKAQKYSLLIIFLTIITFIIIRIIRISNTPAAWELDIKRNPLFRLDSFFVGILMAYILLYKQKLGDWLKYSGTVFFILADLIAVSWFFYTYIYHSVRILNTDFFFRTFGFTLFSFLFAMLLPWLTTINRIPPLFQKCCLYLSQISFVLYLIHLTIFQIIKSQHFANPILMYSIACIISFLISTGIFKIETALTKKSIYKKS